MDDALSIDHVVIIVLVIFGIGSLTKLFELLLRKFTSAGIAKKVGVMFFFVTSFSIAGVLLIVKQ